MPLPEPKPTARRPSAALEANMRSEDDRERGEGLKLTYLQEKEETVSLSLSPIKASAMTQFETFFLQLRAQDRGLKRYNVMDALMLALEDEDVQRLVVARVKR